MDPLEVYCEKTETRTDFSELHVHLFIYLFYFLQILNT